MKTKQIQKNILEGWRHAKLGDFLNKIEGGGTPSKLNPDFWNGSIPWASVKDIVTHNPYDTQDHISEDGLKSSSSRIISKGTLIVPTRMALGHAVFFKVEVAINQDLKALYPTKSLSNKYLFYWFLNKKPFIKRLGSGSTVDGIQQNELKSIKFILPPLTEQKRIVEVLEVWDGVIEKLGRKIELKKNIKKGLMQNLLIGKIRLSGFSGEWENVKLQDIAINLDNKRIPLNSEDRSKKKGVIPYCGANGIVDYIDDFIFNEDIILIAEDGGQFDEYSYRPIAYRITGKCWVNNHAHVVKAKKGFSQDLLFYLTVHKNILKYLNGGTRAKLNKSELLSMAYFVPKSKKEQTAIANILTTADDEIEALEKKKEIIEAQKKYLLNNLITGKIRTPDPVK